MAKEEELYVQLATRIPKELHRQLKLYSVESDTSVMEFVVSAVAEKLTKAGGPKRTGRDRS